MTRFHAKGLIERTVTKGFFRAVDVIPGAKAALFAR